jgi:two-component system chemotaxis sensor kinase CheA
MPLDQDPKAYPLAEFRKTYFEECAELLDALQSHLDVLANGGGDNETRRAIFRAGHSIKGGAGAFGFNALVSFSHVFESLLEAMRDGKVSATSEVVQRLLRTSDGLCDIVNAARQEQELAGDFGADLVAAMEEALHGAANPMPAPAHPAATVAASEEEGARRSWRIRLAPHAEMLQKANEPRTADEMLADIGGATLSRADVTP